MKRFIFPFVLLLIHVSLQAQYYYKDLVVNRQTMETWKDFRKNGVGSVKLVSYDGNDQPTAGFDCHQTVSGDFTEITTYTNSNVSAPSLLIAHYNAQGFLTSTVDTSDRYRSVTEYSYDQAGRIQSIVNRSVETDNGVTNTETHNWTYNDKGTPVSMLRIRNTLDTTYVRLVADDKGNIIEEHATRKGTGLPAIYYYYNGQNQLTDIVRYNEKARRLLPDYIFEPDANGRLQSMLFVPEGTGNYQKWVYAYNDRGLKSEDRCYNKQRELLGRIAYQYTYRK